MPPTRRGLQPSGDSENRRAAPCGRILQDALDVGTGRGGGVSSSRGQDRRPSSTRRGNLAPGCGLGGVQLGFSDSNGRIGKVGVIQIRRPAGLVTALAASFRAGRDTTGGAGGISSFEAPRELRRQLTARCGRPRPRVVTVGSGKRAAGTHCWVEAAGGVRTASTARPQK